MLLESLMHYMILNSLHERENNKLQTAVYQAGRI
jgi:hypothetical protein